MTDSVASRALRRRRRRPFQTLPDDVLQRVLAGVPLDDHQATAAAWQSFRAVISGPRFPALRQLYGCAERGIVLVGPVFVGPNRLVGQVSIRLAHESGALARISGDLEVDNSSRLTTDGGARVFVSSRGPNQILAIDVSSRRWRRPTAAPLDQSGYCMEWCGGRLYVACGLTAAYAHNECFHNSLHAFDESTGLWEYMPPMPHACTFAASGVIDNQLFIAGGYTSLIVAGFSATLQIYNTVTKAWRLGAPPPEFGTPARGVVLEGKLFVFGSLARVVYDPQSDAWTDESVPWSGRLSSACAHDGRIVVFTEDRTAFARAADGTWSPYEIAETPALAAKFWPASGSALLG